MDPGSEIYSLSGLSTIDADEISVSELQADVATIGNLFVTQNETIAGNLNIKGDQVQEGNVVVKKDLTVDQVLYVGRTGASSKIVMNASATGMATKVGLYYQNGGSTSYPLLVTSTLGDELVLSVPNNASYGDIRIRPRVLSAIDESNQVILSKPSSTLQMIDSDILMNSLTATSVDALTSLRLNGSDFKEYFGVSGMLTYDPGVGGTSLATFGLSQSSVRNLFTSANNGLSINNTSGVFTSVWDADSNSVFPRAGSGVTQLSLTNSSAASSTQINLNNDMGSASLFLNGSTRSGDNSPNDLVLRNNVSKVVKVQDSFSFDTAGPSQKINGDPIANAMTWGSSTASIRFRSGFTNYATGEMFAGGVYSATAATMVPNFDNTASSFTLPASSVLTPFLIRYNSSGNVTLAYSFGTNRETTCTFVYVGGGAVWMGGSFAHNGFLSARNFDGTNSKYSFPSTGTNQFCGYLIGWNLTTGVVARFMTMDDASTSSLDSINDMVVDNQGNVFAIGSVWVRYAGQIKDLNNTNTAYNLSVNASYQMAYVLRWSNLGALTGFWIWNLPESSLGWSIDLDNSYNMMVTLTVYNTVARMIPAWGGGVSGTSFPAATNFNNAILRFQSVNNTSFNGVVQAGRNCINNPNASIFQKTIVRYNPTYGLWYWSGQYSNSAQATYFQSFYSTATFSFMPPVSANNFGLYSMIFNNDGTNTQYGVPMTLSNYYAGDLDELILNVRYNPFNYQMYICGNTLSNSTPRLNGWYSVGSSVRFPSYMSPFHTGFVIAADKNVIKGFYLQPSCSSQSPCVDMMFPNATTIFGISNRNGTSSQWAQNFDGYNSGYSLPGNSYSYGVGIKFGLTTNLKSYFRNNGLGLGLSPDGSAQLQVDKGISCNTYMMARELKSFDTNPPMVSDSVGREIGSFIRSWCNINGIQSPQPIVKASMNVYYVSKVANGVYTVYFSQSAPHSNYCIGVSSVGYSSNNYSVMPFIAASSTVTQTVLYKDRAGYTVSCVQSGGGSYDVGEFNTWAIW